MSDLVRIERRVAGYFQGEFLNDIAKLDAVIRYAASIKDWSLVEEAIDRKLEEIIGVVLWWDANVGRRSNEYPNLIPVDEAKQKTGLTKLQISRWRRSIGISEGEDGRPVLGNVEMFRERLIDRVRREAGLGPVADPSSLRPQPDRDGPDFWPTPTSLIVPLTENILPFLPEEATIWECAAGDRRLAVAMRQAGREVIESDLYPQDGLCEPLDFLTASPPLPGMIVVTNPPYNASDKFLERGLSLLDQGQTSGLVLLLRHDHLQAAGRIEAFNRATWEVHCNWRPIWIDGTDGQPRWSFHWIVWTDQRRRPPRYLADAA